MNHAGLVLDLEQLDPEQLRRMSRTEYDRLVGLGLFEDEKVELLRGLLVTMSPQGTRHIEAVRRLNTRLVLALHDRAVITPQGPYAASDDSEPEPDLSVSPEGNYLADHPRVAHLVIEVSASSLKKDRHIKASIYAENGVPEYWIVNLVDGVIEVHTEPRDGAYQQVTPHGRGAVVTLTAFPDVSIAVDEVLP